MKKASSVFLPLLTILVACSKQTSTVIYHDIFDEVRNTTYDAETAERLSTSFSKICVVSKYIITGTNYTKVGSVWQQGSSTTNINYSETILDSREPNPSFQYSTGECDENGEYKEANMNIRFCFRKINGTFTLLTDYGIDGFFIPNMNEIYQRVYDSPFIWNASFFAGTTHFLIANEQDLYMSDVALEYLTTSFSLEPDPEFDSTLRIIGGDETRSFTTIVGDTLVTYCVKQYEATYGWTGLLQYYDVTFEVTHQTSSTAKIVYDIQIHNNESEYSGRHLD